MPKELELCVEKVMQTGKHTKSEAYAICNAAMQKPKEAKPKDMSSKNEETIEYTLASSQRPTLDNPKHSQEYAAFTDNNPLVSSCMGCAFFIQGDSTSDNQCQLVKPFPLRILPTSYCRFWKSLDQLSGFIPHNPVKDDTLPEDLKSLLGDNDVV